MGPLDKPRGMTRRYYAVLHIPMERPGLGEPGIRRARCSRVEHPRLTARHRGVPPCGLQRLADRPAPHAGRLPESRPSAQVALVPTPAGAAPRSRLTDASGDAPRWNETGPSHGVRSRGVKRLVVGGVRLIS